MRLTDIEVLKSFDARKGIFVAVVGEGSGQHLETRSIGCIGRFFRWLGLAYTNTLPDRIEAYVKAQISSWSKDDVPLAATLLQKLEKYHHNHPRRSIITFELIADAFNALQASFEKVHGPCANLKKLDVPVGTWYSVDVAGLNKEGIQALSSFAIQRNLHRLSDYQIGMIDPAKMQRELLTSLSLAGKLQPLQEAQLKVISKDDLSYLMLLAKTNSFFADGQLPYLTEKMNSFCFNSLSKEQFEKLDATKMTRELLLEMGLAARKLSPAQLKICAHNVPESMLGENSPFSADQQFCIYQARDAVSLKNYLCSLKSLVSLSTGNLGQVDLSDLRDEQLKELPFSRLSAASLNRCLARLGKYEVMVIPDETFKQLDFTQIPTKKFLEVIDSQEKFRQIPGKKMKGLLDSLIKHYPEALIRSLLSPEQMIEMACA